MDKNIQINRLGTEQMRLNIDFVFFEEFTECFIGNQLDFFTESCSISFELFFFHQNVCIVQSNVILSFLASV